MSIAKEIKKIIDENSNALFCAKDFLSLTSYNNAKLVLSRLSSSGKIKRLIDGIYYKPTISKYTNKEVLISPYEFVNKIADLYDWSVCLYGEASLNYFGISTQVSSKYVFISDGPYRDYYLGNTLIRFKHTNKNIKNNSFRVSTALEAIKYLGKDNIDNYAMMRIHDVLEQQELELLLQSAKKSAIWIYQIAERIVQFDDKVN